nr:MAG TPA: hypothetical protein [Caudoviricetes sp.]
MILYTVISARLPSRDCFQSLTLYYYSVNYDINPIGSASSTCFTDKLSECWLNNLH